jgi:hypothetical protein
MIKFFTRCFAMLLLVAAATLHSYGQTPFYTEDFSNGLPASWTNVDGTSIPTQAVIFQHSTDPAAVAVAALGYVPSSTFSAATAANGYVWANSDRGLPSAPAEDHTTQLTTAAINCSGQDIVFLRFQSLIGVFDYDASENVRVRVSNDNGTTWTDFVPFPCLVTGAAAPPCTRWSANPEIVGLDISSAAANQAAVLIQFQWIGGWDYFWAIDDIELINQDLSIQNDMQVNTFFARAPNAVTPASQLEPFGFVADVLNNGAQIAQSSTLTVSIKDADDTEVFTSSIQYGSIASDSTAENVFFTDEFTPPNTPGELYTGSYTISLGGATDEEPDNDSRSFQFAVSDTTFAKEFGTGLVGLRYGGADGQTRSYSWGNIFYVPNGDGYAANSVSFFLANADELAGRTISTFLYRWDGDVNEDDQINIAELAGGAPISFNSYEITGEETGLVTIPVDLDGNQIALEDGYHYFIAVQYATEDDQFMFLAATQLLDYTGMWFYSDSLNRPRYAAAADVGNTGTYFLTFNAVPVIRLNIGPLTSTQEPTLPAGSVSVFPNPADEEVKVAFYLETPSSKVEMSIMDMAGKVIRTERHQNVYRDQLTVNTANLPAGAYNVRILTDQGVTVQRISVQH